MPTNMFEMMPVAEVPATNFFFLGLVVIDPFGAKVVYLIRGGFSHRSAVHRPRQGGHGSPVSVGRPS